jgi:hypothetical protein
MKEMQVDRLKAVREEALNFSLPLIAFSLVT